MIIIVPTRELALQISEVATVLLRQFPWIVFGSLMGGESKKKEKGRLRKGLGVIVATPGRLLDHLQNTASFEVSKLEWLIFDEADRLLDLGFEFAIKKILSMIDERKSKDVKRQNLLISATLEGGIQKLATISLHSPVYVNLEDEDVDDDVVLKNSSAKPVHSLLDDSDDIQIVQVENDDNNEEFEQFKVPKHLIQSYTIVETKQKLISLITFLRLQSFAEYVFIFILYIHVKDVQPFLQFKTTKILCID